LEEVESILKEMEEGRKQKINKRIDKKRKNMIGKDMDCHADRYVGGQIKGKRERGKKRKKKNTEESS
jgi:hypothetical protein